MFIIYHLKFLDQSIFIFSKLSIDSRMLKYRINMVISLYTTSTSTSTEAEFAILPYDPATQLPTQPVGPLVADQFQARGCSRILL